MTSFVSRKKTMNILTDPAAAFIEKRRVKALLRIQDYIHIHIYIRDRFLFELTIDKSMTVNSLAMLIEGTNKKTYAFY